LGLSSRPDGHVALSLPKGALSFAGGGGFYRSVHLFQDPVFNPALVVFLFPLLSPTTPPSACFP